jgi:chromosome segregation ATPase
VEITTNNYKVCEKTADTYISKAKELIKENTSVTKKLDIKKLINYLIVPLIFIGLIVYFVFLNNSYKNLTGKFTRQVEIVNNQNLIITNLNLKNTELSGIIKNYDQKFSFIQTNVAHLQQLTDNLKKSSEDKDIKIKLLEQEKGALESDVKSLRNTIVKMTAEIVEYSDELKKAKTETDQNDLIKKIAKLTEERNFLQDQVKQYEKIIDDLRKENTILAAKLRENLKKEGYEFNSQIGVWPKGAETLMKISRENFKKKLDELNKIKEKEEPKKEEKSEEKPKKQGFFKNLFK